MTIGTMIHFPIEGQRNYHLTSRRKVKVLVQTITTALSEQYNSATADVAWMKNVIDECVNPTSKSTETLTTVVSRMEQYIAEHPMSPKSALVYKPTIKKLQRYEAYKKEIEGKEGFTLYCETIRPEEYLDFREYVINEYIHYNDYPEFYGVSRKTQLQPLPLMHIIS